MNCGIKFILFTNVLRLQHLQEKAFIEEILFRRALGHRSNQNWIV